MNHQYNRMIQVYRALQRRQQQHKFHGFQHFAQIWWYECKVLEQLELQKIQILMGENRSQTAEFWFGLLGNMSDAWTESFISKLQFWNVLLPTCRNLNLVLQVYLSNAKGTMTNPCICSEQTAWLSLSSENRCLWFIKFQRLNIEMHRKYTLTKCIWLHRTGALLHCVFHGSETTISKHPFGNVYDFADSQPCCYISQKWNIWEDETPACLLQKCRLATFPRTTNSCQNNAHAE